MPPDGSPRAVPPLTRAGWPYGSGGVPPRPAGQGRADGPCLLRCPLAGDTLRNGQHRPGTGASDNGAPDTGEPAYVATAENGAYAEHIARHDPSRTLAEVAARRQILDEYEKQSWILGQGHRTPELEAAQSVREKVLRLLALPYATHPAYQEEWRP